MGEVKKVIEGAHTLETIEEIIATKEAVGYRFVRSDVQELDLRPVNIVVFENLGLERPKTRLRLSRKAPAAGPRPVWQGRMCVGDHLVQVAAYRDAEQD
jgi:hypothetical protein